MKMQKEKQRRKEAMIERIKNAGTVDTVHTHNVI